MSNDIGDNVMKALESRYTLKLLITAGDYGKTEHEELTQSIAAEEGDTADECMAEAIRVCMANSKVVARKKKERK